MLITTILFSYLKRFVELGGGLSFPQVTAREAAPQVPIFYTTAIHERHDYKLLLSLLIREQGNAIVSFMGSPKGPMWSRKTFLAMISGRT